jgi:hypothetical protein
MKQDQRQIRRAIGLLLAASALPLSPSLAQEATPPADIPVIDVPPPQTSTPDPSPVQTAPVTPAPVTVAPVAPTSPAAETPSAEAETPPPARRTATRTTATRQTTRTPARASVAAPVAATAPAASAATAAAAAAPAVPTAAAPEVLSAPEPAPADIAPAAPTSEAGNAGSILPWAIGGIALLGALAALLLWRRRRRHQDMVYEDEVYETDEAMTVPPAPARASSPIADTVAVAPVAAGAEMAAAVAADESGRPWIDLTIRPVRAGVEGDEAKVEFALDLANQGDAPARDVRVSTWMFPAGSGASEMEQHLIEPGPQDEAGELPPTTIEAGAGARIDATVALSTTEIGSDAVLPVVIAEARYRLPDGSEGRTAASFAVGVPDGEELAHFDVEHPSGLHDTVEARALGEPERA